MNKYTDVEILTAKNLLKEGYKWIVRYESGRLFAYCKKPIKVGNVWDYFGDSVCICEFVPIFQSIRFGDKEPTSLETIVHPPILDGAEKRYLKGVIRPFRNNVKSISKGYTSPDKEFILICCKDGDEADLPYFETGTMYKGMENNRNYTLEELGL